jgi:hypothetical protein
MPRSHAVQIGDLGVGIDEEGDARQARNDVAENCRRLRTMSAPNCDSPVMFLPGRARLSTNLLPTGSGTKLKATGIEVVASLA